MPYTEAQLEFRWRLGENGMVIYLLSVVCIHTHAVIDMHDSRPISRASTTSQVWHMQMYIPHLSHYIKHYMCAVALEHHHGTSTLGMVYARPHFCSRAITASLMEVLPLSVICCNGVALLPAASSLRRTCACPHLTCDPSCTHRWRNPQAPHPKTRLPEHARWPPRGQI
jgi:hypothetical protein